VTTAAAAAALLLASLSANAANLTELKLRVGGREVPVRTPAVFDGREVYIPLDALQALGATFVLTLREETAVVSFKNGATQEIALARPGPRPMLPLSALARAGKLSTVTEGGVCEILREGERRQSPAKPQTPPPPKGDPSSRPAEKTSDVQKPLSPDAGSTELTVKLPPAGTQKIPTGSQGANPSGTAAPAFSSRSGAQKPAPMDLLNPMSGVMRVTAGPTSRPGKLIVQDAAIVAVNPRQARLMIRTNGKPNAFARLENNPSRLTIDIQNASVEEPREIPVDHPFARRMFIEPGDAPGAARVVLELDKLVGYNISPAGPEGLAITLNLPRGAGRRLEDMVIVVDPGHGGNSGLNPTGCSWKVGTATVYEKHLTLAIASQVRRHLEEAGATVIMTRTADVSLSLEARAAIANRAGADMLVSIHIDSCGGQNTASGTTTYYHKTDSSSRALAHSIVENIASVSGLPNRRARSDSVLYRNGLGVLRAAAVPATLVEVGFINNARDRAKLVDPSFQEAVGRAVVDGIRGYATATLPDSETASAADRLPEHIP
jgi:N-acetylmuramoyl-L-alanine amidase